MPTFYHGSRARLYMNGRDLSTYTRQIQGGITVDTADVSTLGEIAKKYLPGLQDSSFSTDGIFDGSASRSDDFFQAVLSASEPAEFTWVINGDLIGRTAYGMELAESQYGITAGMSDAATYAFAGKSYSTGGMERCVVVWAGSSMTSASTGTGVDLNPSNVYGGVAFLQVLAQTGSFAYAFQDSADNVTFNNIGGASGVVASGNAYTAYRVAISPTTGSIRRYVRFSGSPQTSAQVHAILGRKYFS